MDLTFSARNVTISPNNGRVIEIEISEVAPSDILDQFEVTDIVSQVGYEKLLDAMDIDDIKKHLGLVESE